MDIVSLGIRSSPIYWRCSSQSDDSIFLDYGIEKNRTIPFHRGKYNAANHIRALLDLLAEGKYSIAQGMKEDYICNDIYTEEIFQKVSLMQELDNWPNIDRFMEREYGIEWTEFNLS